MTAKRLVEVVEEGEAPIEAGLIVAVRHEHAQEKLLDAARLGVAELSILDVDVVDNLSQSRERWVFDPGPDHQRLEGAAVFLVGEVPVNHVEADLLRRHLVCPGIDEAKAGLWIQKASDEPRRRDAIHLDSPPRHPGSPDQVAMAGRRRRRRLGQELTLEGGEGGLRLPAGRGVEEIDLPD